MTFKKQVLITTGDPDGIGQEITIKALRNLPVHKSCRVVIFSSKKNKWPGKIGPYRIRHFSKESDLQLENLEAHQIAVVSLGGSPHAWVKSAAKRALKYAEKGVALVNAPMSKNGRGHGHTEILKDVSGNKNLYMGFLGHRFNVCLATTHIPVDQVFDQLDSKAIRNSYRAALKLHELGGGKQALKILGLNPHSGENGAISRQDLRLQKYLPKKSGPLLVPDAAFINHRKSDTYLAWYHDQGLIPFKLVHGFSHGIQVTLGLPFIRTSVDHGTAKDIFGKGIANHQSLLLALKKGRQLAIKYGNTNIPSQE